MHLWLFLPIALTVIAGVPPEAIRSAPPHFLNPNFLTKYPDALCLDGSPGAYFIDYPQQIADSTSGNIGDSTTDWSKIVFFLEGGGWCTDESDCWRRSMGYLGTSVGLGILPPFSALSRSDSKQGLFRSPGFDNHTAILVHYCDGTSFLGDRDDVLLYKNNRTTLSTSDVRYEFSQIVDYTRIPATNIKERGIFSGYMALENATQKRALLRQRDVFVKQQSMGRLASVADMPEDGTTHPIFFRGKHILDSVVKDLHRQFNILNKVQEVVLTGSSAGGLSVLLNLDRLGERFFNKNTAPSLKSYGGVMTSGFFLDRSDVKGNRWFDGYMRNIARLSRAVLPKRCVNGIAKRANAVTSPADTAPNDPLDNSTRDNPLDDSEKVTRTTEADIETRTSTVSTRTDSPSDNSDIITNLSALSTTDFFKYDFGRCFFAEHVIADGVNHPLLVLNSKVDAWQLTNVALDGFLPGTAEHPERPYSERELTNYYGSVATCMRNAEIPSNCPLQSDLDQVVGFGVDFEDRFYMAVEKSTGRKPDEKSSDKDYSNGYPVSSAITSCLDHCEADSAWPEVHVPDPKAYLNGEFDVDPKADSMVNLGRLVQIWMEEVLRADISSAVRPYFRVPSCNLHEKEVKEGTAALADTTQTSSETTSKLGGYKLVQCNPSCSLAPTEGGPMSAESKVRLERGKQEQEWVFG